MEIEKKVKEDIKARYDYIFSEIQQCCPNDTIEELYYLIYTLENN